jgi:phosphatidate cytidylyltransferase
MNGFLTTSPNVLWVVAAMLATLTTGTLVRVQSLRGAASDLAKQRLASLRSWWLVAGVVILAALLGLGASALLFVMVSVLAMREFLRLVEDGPSSRVKTLIYCLIPLNYGLVWLRWHDAFALFIPLASIMVVGLGLILEQRTQGFLRSAAGSVWGLLVTSYLLAHAVLLFTLPETANTVAGGAGWFLLLIVLTEANDIMQALVGRRIGRWKLAVRLSPHKTWEGFMGGVVSTVLLAMLLAPWLTPLAIWQAALAGLLISAGGLVGDLNISALKRDAGVKDSGTLLPGQGGILDRIDSLTFTAPLFYYLVRILAP